MLLLRVQTDVRNILSGLLESCLIGVLCTADRRGDALVLSSRRLRLLPVAFIAGFKHRSCPCAGLCSGSGARLCKQLFYG